MSEGTNSHPASFRDPSGHVVIEGDKIHRHLSEEGLSFFRLADSAGIFSILLEQDLILPLEIVTDSIGRDCRTVLLQPLLPWPSSPYEWTFDGLRDAALLHIRVHRLALARGFTLSDASSFNIQFDGCRPFFVDLGSFVPFTEGRPWLGYRQFSEQFLYPLLLESLTGQAFNPIFRGNGTGITAAQMAAWLPRLSMLRLRELLHVYLPHWLNQRMARNAVAGATLSVRRMSAEVLDEMLAGLARWLKSLKTPLQSPQRWGSYAAERIYTSEEGKRKRAFVTDFIKASGIKSVLDLGCNTGELAQCALAAGATRAIGYERDSQAANIAYLAAKNSGANFLPLITDLTNPSPDQGWAQKEWPGFFQRTRAADSLLALALVHHLALGEGIPLAKVLTWLVSLAPCGIIEFIPPDDEMAQSLSHRVGKRHFAYDHDAFLASLAAVANIVSSRVITTSGRALFAYERHKVQI